MKYATYDDIGKINAFYDDEVYNAIPINAIAITDQEWLDATQYQNKYRVDEVNKKLKIISDSLPPPKNINWSDFRRQILADFNYQNISNTTLDQRSVTRLESAATVKSDDWGALRKFWNSVIQYASSKPSAATIATWNEIARINNMPFSFDSGGLLEASVPPSEIPIPAPPSPNVPSIKVDWTPPNNSLVTATNLQSAMEQMIAVIKEQQTQIQLLTPKTLPPLIEDNFTSILDVALDLHTPTIYQGSRWVKKAGGWKTSGGFALSDGITGSLAFIESGRADKITIEADVFLVDSNVQQGIIFRLNSTNNYHWRAVYTKTKFEIIEVSTSTISRVNFPEAIAFNQSYKFKVLLDGANINFLVNGISKCSWMSSNLIAETKVGLYSSTSAATRFDSFRVTPT